MSRIITHYFPQPPEPDSWIPLTFFSRETDDEKHYFVGFSKVPHPKAEIDERVKNNEIKAIVTPQSISPDDALWLSPSGAIWLAVVNDPINDKGKLLVDSIQLQRLERVSIKERISKRIVPNTTLSEMLVLNKSYVHGNSYNKLLKILLLHLSQRNNSEPKQLASSVPWDQVPAFMVDGRLDFCCDPYFATHYREHIVNVLMFGKVETYCCFVSSASTIAKRLYSTKKMKSAKDRLLDLWYNINGLKVGLIRDTAAASEVRRILSDTPGISDRFENPTDVITLRDWIGEAPDTRMIICDHGIAEELNEIKAENIKDVFRRKPFPGFKKEYSWKEQEFIFLYTNTVNVGFVYPKEDERWLNEIRMAFAMALIEMCLEEARLRKINPWDPSDDTPTIGSELQKVGIVPITFSELCNSLHLQQLEKLTGMLIKENYKEAAGVKTELDKIIASLKV